MASPDYQDLLNILGRPLYFTELPENERTFWFNVLQKIEKICDVIDGFKAVVTLAGVVINILHLKVLTRKSMRDSSVNLILASMAISDIFAMIIAAIDEFRPSYNKFNTCAVPNNFWVFLWKFVLRVFLRCFLRLSSWLSVSMATVRALVIKYATESKFSGLSTPMFGTIVSLIQFGLSLLFTFPLLLSIQVVPIQTWSPNPICPNFPPNYSVPQYKAVFINLSSEEFSYLDAISSNVIPCLLYPILTAVLVLDLRKARKKMIAMRRVDDSNIRATKLIISMTICFMIAEFPQGIVSLLHPLYKEGLGMGLIYESLQESVPILSHINCCSHLFLCLGMSSKYRNTFCETFGLKETEDVSTIEDQNDSAQTNPSRNESS